jgi:Skp family chaperone for outer membrane proteins
MALALAHPGATGAQEVRPTVAFYDAGAVLRATGVFAPERERLARIAADLDAEAELLRRAVYGLRDAVTHGRDLPEAERRDLEARLAQSTIALMVARTEGARELAHERADVLERLEGSIVPAVVRVAQEHGLAVVIRTNEATVVLDEDALDLTGLVIDALDDARETPEPLTPREKRRTRLQSCDAGTEAVLAAGTLAATN